MMLWQGEFKSACENELAMPFDTPFDNQKIIALLKGKVQDLKSQLARYRLSVLTLETAPLSSQK